MEKDDRHKSLLQLTGISNCLDRLPDIINTSTNYNRNSKKKYLICKQVATCGIPVGGFYKSICNWWVGACVKGGGIMTFIWEKVT